MSDELNFSALGALKLPEIKINNSGDPVEVVKKVQKPSVEVISENDELEDDFGTNILEVESIDDLNNIIDNTSKPIVKDDEFESTNKNPEDSNEEEDPYAIYGSWIKENSILDFDEEEFNKSKDKNDFLIKKEIEKFENAIEEYKSNQSPYIKQLMDMEDDGIDIAKVLKHDAVIQSYDKLSIEKIKESEDLQKTIVKDYLRRQGNTEDEIQEEIQEMEDSLTLDKKAEKWFPKLREFELKEKDRYIKETLKQQKLAEQEYQNSLKETKTYIDKLDSLLPNIPLTKEEKQKIFDNMTKQDRNGETALMKASQKDPLKFNAMITYLATIKNFDFEDVVKKVATQTTKEIKSKLNSSSVPEKVRTNLSIFKKALGK